MTLVSVSSWVDRVPMPLVRTIGVLEVLGAAGLVLIQVGGIAVHLSRGEARLTGLDIGLLVAAIAAVGLATTWL
jgi:hypothetical protein